MAIVDQGLDAMRRYYAELQAASAASVTLKAVLVGPGEAGKTSLLRRLRDADGAVLPAASDRTIGLEMTAVSLDPENDPKLKLLMCGGMAPAERTPLYLSRARCPSTRALRPPHAAAPQ